MIMENQKNVFKTRLYFKDFFESKNEQPKRPMIDIRNKYDQQILIWVSLTQDNQRAKSSMLSPNGLHVGFLVFFFDTFAI